MPDAKTRSGLSSAEIELLPDMLFPSLLEDFGDGPDDITDRVLASLRDHDQGDEGREFTPTTTGLDITQVVSYSAEIVPELGGEEITEVRLHGGHIHLLRLPLVEFVGKRSAALKYLKRTGAVFSFN